MHVVEVSTTGGPEVLRLVEPPDPAPGSGEAVVKVQAANVNPTDLGARGGHGPRAMPDPPYVLGWDFAGEVVAVGDEATDVSPGDRVVGMIHWYDNQGELGAYAEQVVVPAEWLVPLPNAIDATAAATIPLNALTAAQGLAILDLPSGASLLVTGASGAVGSFAVQLAKAAGLRVLAEASDGDEAWVQGLGADELVARDADFPAVGRSTACSTPFPSASRPTRRCATAALRSRPARCPSPTRPAASASRCSSSSPTPSGCASSSTTSPPASGGRASIVSCPWRRPPKRTGWSSRVACAARSS